MKEQLHKAFSLLEIVIVVAIIVVVMAIAIPRMSRGGKGASESALTHDLLVLRNAIDHYAAEHGGAYPTTTDIAGQLTQYTDISGDPQAAKDITHMYGPYVRSIPPLPVGQRKGNTGIAASDGPGVGWIYDETTGSIRANTLLGDKDASIHLYRDH